MYLVWDEEAELSEEDTVLTSLLTGSDEDSEAEGPKAPKKAAAGKASKKQKSEESDDDDDDSEDFSGVVSSSELRIVYYWHFVHLRGSKEDVGNIPYM